MKDKNGTEIKDGDEVTVLVRATYRNFGYWTASDPVRLRHLVPADLPSIIEVTRLQPPAKAGQIYRTTQGGLRMCMGQGKFRAIRGDVGQPLTHYEEYEVTPPVFAEWELVVDVP